MVWPMVAAGTSNDDIMAARDIRPVFDDGQVVRHMTRHTLSVLVENKPGVLARVSALFSRRGFNIESLAVGPTENPDVSRMTIVVDAESAAAGAGHQAAQQAGQRAQDRRARGGRRGPARAAAGQGPRAAGRPHAGAADRRAVPGPRGRRRPETVTVEATGTPDKLEALLAVLEPFGIKEMVQSGMVALGRGPRSMTGAGSLRPVERSA